MCLLSHRNGLLSTCYGQTLDKAQEVTGKRIDFSPTRVREKQNAGMDPLCYNESFEYEDATGEILA